MEGERVERLDCVMRCVDRGGGGVGMGVEIGVWILNRKII